MGARERRARRRLMIARTAVPPVVPTGGLAGWVLRVLGFRLDAWQERVLAEQLRIRRGQR